MLKKKTKTLSFKIDEDLKERITNQAQEEKRTTSNLVVKVLTDYLNEIDEAKNKLTYR